MAPRQTLPAAHRLLLEEFGYQWSKELDAWTNRDGGRALSFETVSRWTLDELRGWLAQGAK